MTPINGGIVHKNTAQVPSHFISGNMIFVLDLPRRSSYDYVQVIENHCMKTGVFILMTSGLTAIDVVL
jgi:hypothetical protein